MNLIAKINKVEALKQEKDGLDVYQDILRFSRAGSLAGVAETDLTRMRWFGVYQQKPNDQGFFMLRIRVPGGGLNPAPMRAIAGLADRHARGFSDITTRQDIQLHWLRVEHLADALQTLSSVGMSSQFACGDTPRNVVSCPLAGVMTEEFFDARPQVEAVSQMFLDGGKEFSNLPRKFKTAIGACAHHCHQPQINDIGFYGVRRADGSVGYGLVVGGGLSDSPHFAQPLRVFVRPEQAVDVARAIVLLFRDQGYREKRGHARLKFLVADKGWEWTRDQIEQSLGYALERDDSLLHPRAVHTDHLGVGRQKDGRWYVGVPIRRGRWSAQQMHAVADLADRFAAGPKRIRLTSKQNALILDVPAENRAALVRELEAADLSPHAHILRDLVVSCTGIEFCNLAVVETKERSAKILKYLEEHVPMDDPVMVSVSGCPNTCAQSPIADIGLSGIPVPDPVKTDDKGRPRKVEGYSVGLGGCLGTDPKFGRVIVKKVPADRVHLSIENLIRHFHAERTDDEETFAAWCWRSEAAYLERLILEPVLSPTAAPLE